MVPTAENSENLLVCPKCSNTMRAFNLGYSCTGSECTFWVPREIRQKVLSKDVVKELLENRKTGDIKGFHKRGNSQTFSASLYITDQWKIKLRLAGETDLICPACGKLLIHFERGYKCVDEENCNYVLWDQFGGKPLTEELMKTILIEKKTDIIKGFISRKNGKRFSARIVMGDKGMLRFEFEDRTDKENGKD